MGAQGDASGAGTMGGRRNQSCGGKGGELSRELVVCQIAVAIKCILGQAGCLYPERM